MPIWSVAMISPLTVGVSRKMLSAISLDGQRGVRTQPHRVHLSRNPCGPGAGAGDLARCPVERPDPAQEGHGALDSGEALFELVADAGEPDDVGAEITMLSLRLG